MLYMWSSNTYPGDRISNICTSLLHTHIDIDLSHHRAQSYLYICSVRWVCQNAHSSTAECVIAGRTEKESPGQDSLADLILSELATTQVLQAPCPLYPTPRLV